MLGMLGLFRKLGIVTLVFAFAGGARAETDFVALGAIEGPSYSPVFGGHLPEGYHFKIDRFGLAELVSDDYVLDGGKDWWKVSCETDAMTDVRHCVVDWANPALLDFHTFGNRVIAVCANNTRLITGTAMVRIGSGKPQRGINSRCFSVQTMRAITQAKEGTLIRVRTFHFGDFGVVDTAAPMSAGFKLALDMAQFLSKGKDRQIHWPN